MNVCRLCDLRSVWAGEERYPAGSGQLLPHPAAQWCDLARGGDADFAAVYLKVSAAHTGHHFSPLHTDPRLGHHGDRRLGRLCVHNHLDRCVPLHQSDSAQGEARLNRTHGQTSGTNGAKNARSDRAEHRESDVSQSNQIDFLVQQ